MISRHLQPIIESWLFKGKIIILYGARQVGKTTLAKAILLNHEPEAVYLNCEIQAVNQVIRSQNPLVIKQLIGNARLVVLDEAQHVEGIGLSLKIFHDTYPDIQIIATGSSSFSLSNNLSEPLTGRAIEFLMYPFSFEEFSQSYTQEEKLQLLPFMLRFGLYPDIAGKAEDEARFLLDNLTSNYLFRDILALEQLRKPAILVNLLRLLAFQTGSEVSVNELSVNLGLSRKTVEHYIDVLERSFILFRLTAFSRNLRQEINKKFKLYFYDVGIRNSIISAFNPLDFRNDTGALWENFLLAERKKMLQKQKRYVHQYFWRTHQQQEIDYIEEENGILTPFEFKYSEKYSRLPNSFKEAYAGSALVTVNKLNWLEFIHT